MRVRALSVRQWKSFTSTGPEVCVCCVALCLCACACASVFIVVPKRGDKLARYSHPNIGDVQRTLSSTTTECATVHQIAMNGLPPEWVNGWRGRQSDHGWQAVALTFE